MVVGATRRPVREFGWDHVPFWIIVTGSGQRQRTVTPVGQVTLDEFENDSENFVIAPVFVFSVTDIE
ncbi:hypothetical protein [Novosphingobium gossypii]|uniref:hypothetical protein n=1 Tax=Novosphingobium gossypii TaxID=1604774 RepID=UPI003D1B41E8